MLEHRPSFLVKPWCFFFANSLSKKKQKFGKSERSDGFFLGRGFAIRNVFVYRFHGHRSCFLLLLFFVTKIQGSSAL